MTRTNSSSKYEKKRAKDLGVKTNKGSGATNDDADFRLKGFLIEHKFRSKQTVWASLAWWKKVKKQAIFLNRKPALILENNDCSVIYFEFGDIDMLKHKFDLELINSANSKWLKNHNFSERVTDAQVQGKIFVLEYSPEKIMIMEIEDFKDMINGHKEK
jgi:hypothetical protein